MGKLGGTMNNHVIPKINPITHAEHEAKRHESLARFNREAFGNEKLAAIHTDLAESFKMLAKEMSVST